VQSQLQQVTEERDSAREHAVALANSVHKLVQIERRNAARVAAAPPQGAGPREGVDDNERVERAARRGATEGAGLGSTGQSNELMHHLSVVSAMVGLEGTESVDAEWAAGERGGAAAGGGGGEQA
jgi:hypothetical protein